MPSNSYPLDIFTDPIAICQSEADLESILNIFQRSHCRSLAVPQHQGNWGIIYSEDLLSLMAQAWLGNKTALVSHPKDRAYQSNIAQITIQNFYSLIEPATVYHADTELQELLSDVQYDSFFSGREEYLVVSGTGKLLGRLNRHKILEYSISNVIDLERINSQPVCLSATEESTNTLLAILSHELKSPLTGIVGLTNLLGEKKLGKLNQRQSSYVNLIHRSGQKMVSIVDNLQALTALTSEQLPLESINLEFLCRQVYQQAAIEIQSSEPTKFDSDLASEPKLAIELGSETTIANRAILSRILFHLMLETFQTSKYSELKLKIFNLQELTAIEVSSNLDEDAVSLASEKTEFSSLTPGLDLAIALYLAETIDATVDRVCWSDCCQFTLLLPKATVPLSQRLSNAPRVPRACGRGSVSVGKSSLGSRATSAEEDRTTTKHLTILCLYPELEASDFRASHNHSMSFDLKSWSDNELHGSQHRIIEANSLEQAHTIARIWELDIIILNGDRIIKPIAYLQSLQESEYLAALPLITFDTKTIEAANQLKGLNIYPCLLPAEHRNVEDLMQVIQIATEA